MKKTFAQGVTIALFVFVSGFAMAAGTTHHSRVPHHDEFTTTFDSLQGCSFWRDYTESALNSHFTVNALIDNTATAVGQTDFQLSCDGKGNGELILYKGSLTKDEFDKLQGIHDGYLDACNTWRPSQVIAQRTKWCGDSARFFDDMFQDEKAKLQSMGVLPPPAVGTDGSH